MLPSHRTIRCLPLFLVAIATVGAAWSGAAAQQVMAGRFDTHSIEPPMLRMAPMGAASERRSLLLRSSAGSAIGLGLSIGISTRLAPTNAGPPLLNALLLSAVASTGGAVIGARSAATAERPVSPSRAVLGAAVGIVPAWVAGTVGGFAGGLLVRDVGVMVGFISGYAFLQGVFTTVATE